eukprot:gb/GECG01003035.1/.p1 GENE.gb/GECG01003035.1/~~gb/GECG01003035.1/.p1  ORF type:complete len:380 (+),score=20.31 gb/GECG01003035.1/:1-1140(+)
MSTEGYQALATKMSPPPPSEVRTGQIVVAVSGCLCMVGALTIIVSFYVTSWGSWRVKDPATASKNEKVKALAQGYLLQLFWLSVSNFFGGAFFALALTIPRDFTVNAACTFQLLGRSYFPLVTAIWNLVLSVELYQFIFKYEFDLCGNFSRRRYYWYHACAWIIPIPCVAGQYFGMRPINEGIWCWIGAFHTNGMMINGISPLPEMAIWFVVMILNLRIVIAVRNTLLAGPTSESTRHAKKFILTLMAYSTTFLVIFIAMLIHEMGVGYVHDETIYGTTNIRYAAAVTVPAQGFLNAIVFALTNSRARDWLCCSRYSRKSSIEEDALGSYRAFSKGSLMVDNGMVSHRLLDDLDEVDGSNSTDTMELNEYYFSGGRGSW